MPAPLSSPIKCIRYFLTGGTRKPVRRCLSSCLPYADTRRCSCVLSLLLQVLYPKSVHMIRGNHEDEEVNYDFGFEQVHAER